MNKARYIAVIGFVLAGAMSRLLPHPPNFTAIDAIALFSGVYLGKRRLALLVIFSSMFLSDLVLGLHPLIPFVYSCIGVTAVLGWRFCKESATFRAPMLLLCSSALFFVVTNFGVWLLGSAYPKTVGGLALCYVAAIPFLGNQILGSLFFGAALFGGFALAERLFPMLRLQQERETVR